MEKHFDLIAMPKGQVPGGPVQASNGDWYFVIPTMLSLRDVVARMEQMQAGTATAKNDRKQLLDWLQDQVAQERQ